MAKNYSNASIRRGLSRLKRMVKLLSYNEHSQTEELYFTIHNLKHSKCLDQNQAFRINPDLLIKMIVSHEDALAGKQNKALISLGYDLAAIMGACG